MQKQAVSGILLMAIELLSNPSGGFCDEKRPVAAAQFDTLFRCIALADYIPPLFHLPLCKDTDDQKFVETAYQCKAAVLITKDKALLRLARQTARLGVCAILTPQAWLKEYGTTQDLPAAMR